jgi:hypothetical protein
VAGTAVRSTAGVPMIRSPGACRCQWRDRPIRKEICANDSSAYHCNLRGSPDRDSERQRRVGRRDHRKRESLKTDSGKWGTGLHARSECAYSGQEDLQFLDDEGNPLPEAHKGEPGHAQSWGLIPKDFRDFLTSIGSNPGLACNPIKGDGSQE